MTKVRLELSGELDCPDEIDAAHDASCIGDCSMKIFLLEENQWRIREKVFTEGLNEINGRRRNRDDGIEALGLVFRIQEVPESHLVIGNANAVGVEVLRVVVDALRNGGAK